MCGRGCLASILVWSTVVMAQCRDVFPDHIEKMINEPDDLVKAELTKNDHNNIMERIGNDMQMHYERLGGRLEVSPTQVKTIIANRRNSDVWLHLNDVIWQWLSWNYNDTLREKYKFKPNKRWLIEAIRGIDESFAAKLEKDYGGVPQQSTTPDTTSYGSDGPASLQ